VASRTPSSQVRGHLLVQRADVNTKITGGFRLSQLGRREHFGRADRYVGEEAHGGSSRVVAGDGEQPGDGDAAFVVLGPGTVVAAIGVEKPLAESRDDRHAATGMAVREPLSAGGRRCFGLDVHRDFAQVQAILHRNLVPRCPAADLFGIKGRVWLAEQQLPADEQAAAAALLRQLDLYAEDCA
jgi:hypothetical protein